MTGDLTWLSHSGLRVPMYDSESYAVGGFYTPSSVFQAGKEKG